jgi:hypothetical protein
MSPTSNTKFIQVSLKEPIISVFPKHIVVLNTRFLFLEKINKTSFYNKKTPIYDPFVERERPTFQVDREDLKKIMRQWQKQTNQI